ncbi:MAG: GspH/FimT family pseudopilin [Minisyncoccia bacterium]
MELPNIYNLNKGITLIEVIIVIAIIGLIISLGTVVSFGSYQKYYFRSENTILVSILMRARSRAMSNSYESPHGVCYVSPNYIIFRGTICNSVLGTNELIPANTEIANLSNFSGTFPTVVFTQLSGITTTATIHITDGISTQDITINNEGVIDW